MEKDDILEFLESIAKNCKNDFPEKKAYKEWINHKKYKEYAHNLTDDELSKIFEKPAEFKDDYEKEISEQGDVLDEKTFSIIDNDPKLSEVEYFGWLQDEVNRINLLNNKYYNSFIRKGLGNIPEEVKENIETHALHILGRCNNPKNWENDNKQGLVYGMVQSGKTASMISLMGLAYVSGFNLIIVLSGDKTSLRNQTQTRINKAFGFSNRGANTGNEKIVSITQESYDYNESRDGYSNGLEVFRDYIRRNESMVICIKKNTNSLRKLVDDLQNVRDNQNQLMEFSFDNHFNALIIDDEADYASQNTKKHGASRINEDITDLRKILIKNTYVAYTATPQACLGADSNALVGYPNDFIWLLDPYRDEEGNTTSYMGLQEFFIKYPKELINTVNEYSWPHWVKDEKGKGLGVFTIDGEILEKNKLQLEENRTIEVFLESELEREAKCHDYKVSIVDYLITCAIRWRRHYIKHIDFFKNSLPTTKDIEEINIDEKFTSKGFPAFPYHAMMFNLAYTKRIHEGLVKLVEILFNEVKLEYDSYKKGNYEDYNNLFHNQFQKQQDKSIRFNKTVIRKEDLFHFIDISISISNKMIVGENNFLYVLNSSDEGQTLNYGSASKENRPKKASIIIGGLILSRGLTIENLSTSVFIRSQSQSLGDTNLQMCRWFGHKKNSIDLISVYMQKHSQTLFEDIAYADNELRNQFWEYICKNTPAECILIQLRNSTLFKLTSPSKSRFLDKDDKLAYSGKSEYLQSPTKHKEYEKNYGLLNNYLSSLNNVPKVMNERAKVYYNVNLEEFLSFFERLKISDDSLFITPKKYIEYLKDWKSRTSGIMPEINIALFGAEGEFLKRKRNKEFIYSNFMGGKSDKNRSKEKLYIGDRFVDFEQDFHKNNYEKKINIRPKGSPILVKFYLLNANYLNKKDTRADSEEVKNGNRLPPIVTYAISTPIGGPLYSVFVNTNKRIQHLESYDKCQELEENKLFVDVNY